MNRLTWTIPQWLGSLVQLYSLNLSSNSLVSNIPDRIENLCDLGVLELHSNWLTGTLYWVFEIGSRFPIGSLTYVDLSYNHFSSGIERIGEGLQVRIDFLNLSQNSLTGRFPGSIGKIESLQVLDISYNKLSFSLPESLANVSTLEKLKLQYNRFTGQMSNGFLKLKEDRKSVV